MEAYQLQEHAHQLNDVAAALIELESMKAANIQRQSQGLSPAYGEEQFRELLSIYSLGYNENIDKSRRFFYK